MSNLKILFLEDLKSDFDLAKNELIRNGFEFEWRRVDNREAYFVALDEFKPDLIISDYMMPQFTGMEALKIARELLEKIPVIILTGSINEETAVKCLKNGADDYVIKEFIGKLPYAVKEVLSQKELHEQKVNAEKALVASEKAYRLLFEANPQPMWVVDDATLKFLAVNNAAIEKFGYSKDEFLGLNAYQIFPLEEQEKFQKFVAENPQSNRSIGPSRQQRKDGTILIVEATANLIDFEGKEARLVLLNDVTEKVQAERSLLQSEENFRESLSNSPLGIRIVSVEGKTIFANQAFLDIYEFNDLDQFVTTPVKERYTPESLISHQKRKQIRKEGGEVSEYNISIRRKSGEVRHILVSRKEVLWNGSKHFQVINQDITLQKNAEIQLRKISRAVEQSPNAILITDTNGNIEYANPKTLSLSGFNSEELIGQNPRIFSSGERPAKEYVELWETVKAGNIWSGEFHNRKKSGELYWEAAVISPIFAADGQITHFLAIKEDITAAKKILQDLIEAKEHAEESDRLKTAFLNNISHEIRTPFNSILGFLSLVQENDLTHDERDEYFDYINGSANRLMSTINDIVEMSRIQAGQLKLTLAEVNIREFTGNLFDQFKADAERKNLEFKLNNNLPKDIERINTDRDKLNIVLTNLLGNALKFTKAGSIELGVCLVNQAVETKHALSLHFYVKDTGIGIPENKRQVIFEHFMQADASSTRQFEGSGLGLAISKAYIEMMGGKIWVESELQKGSSFFVTIPLPDRVEKTGNRLDEVAEKNRSEKSLKILIAEDHEQSAKFLEVVLHKYSQKIFIAKNGLEAIEIFRDNPAIDMILMDIQMPEMDGYEATRQIRQFNTKVIIIAQTAYALSGDKEKALEAGCNDYITKPIKQEKIFTLLQKFIS